MANPLFNGGQNINTAMGNVNPQALNNIMQMIQRGADIKDIVSSFKKSGLSPQLAEQALCMAFPQMKQLKQQMDAMKQSGMSQQEIFADFAKKANVDPMQINQTYNSLMRLVR